MGPSDLKWSVRTVRAEEVLSGLGGATSKPFKVVASDGRAYAVKLPDRKYGCRLLVNELLAGLLAECLGLETPKVVAVEISETILNELTDPTVAERIREASAIFETHQLPGPVLGFGSEIAEGYFPLPDKEAEGAPSPRTVRNLSAVAGAVVFDTWVFNQDMRQFLARYSDAGWDVLLFDHDGAFNRQDWIICTKEGVRADLCSGSLQKWIRGLLKSGDLELFEPALRLLEDDKRWSGLADILGRVPAAWLKSTPGNDYSQVTLPALIDCLQYRRHRVRQFLQREIAS